MTVRQIADALLAARYVTNATADQHEGLQAAFRCSLENNAGKTVERVGEGSPRRWQLKSG
jgi:hypothetical protein